MSRSGTPARSTIGLAGELAGRSFFGGPGPTLAGGMRVIVDWHRRFGVGIDMLAEHTGTTTTLGAISFDSVSASAVAFADVAAGSFTFRAGLGSFFGVARMTGEPASSSSAVGSSFAAPWGGPELLLGAVVGHPSPVASHWFRRGFAELDLQSGLVALPVKALAGGHESASIDGGWLMAGLALGIFP